MGEDNQVQLSMTSKHNVGIIRVISCLPTSYRDKTRYVPTSTNLSLLFVAGKFLRELSPHQFSKSNYRDT